MRKAGQLPVPLQMALGAIGGGLMQHEARTSIEELEAQADLLNDQHRRAEIASQSHAADAFKGTQVQVVLGPGGKHPAFGYEVPVGNDQNMIRTAAVEMGCGMAQEEARFRAAAGRMKLGAVLVELHGGMDKEALGVLRSAYNAAKGGLMKGRKAFGASRQAGGSVAGAASKATSAGGAQAKRTYGSSIAHTPSPKIQAAKPGEGYVRKQSPDPYRTPASKPVTSTEVNPSPSGKPSGQGPKPAASVVDGVGTAQAGPDWSGKGGETGGDVARWGKKWITDPAKKTVKNPWMAAAGLGAAGVSYGGYQAAKAGIDTMQQHNPQYSYNSGGYQVPTSVGRYGYTKAPNTPY